MEPISESSDNTTAKLLIPHKLRMVFMIFVFIAFFVILLLIGILPRIIANKDVMASSKPTLPSVVTAKPSFSHKVPDLVLPGELSPFMFTSIYSRISGLLKTRYVDIGSKVHAGQIIALVDAPDLDRELEQGKATLAQVKQNMNQAKYNYDFAVKSFQRWKVTGRNGAVAQQDIDQRQNNVNTSGNLAIYVY